MKKGESPARAALGFTVKSGWAAAVLVTGSPGSLHVADSRRIELSDPAIPESRQPYHQGFGTARASGPTLTRLVGSVQQFGKHSVAALIQDYQTLGYRVEGVGVVVGSLIDPERIANDHIRIHALEGRLFRRVVEETAAENALPHLTWRDRELYTLAAKVLQQPEQHVRASVAALRGSISGSWRAEQKAAALAAWLVLATAQD